MKANVTDISQAQLIYSAVSGFFKTWPDKSMFSPCFQGLQPPPSFTSLFPRPHHQHPTVHITAQLVCPMDRPFGKHTPMPWSQCVYPNPLPPALLQRTQEVFLSVTDRYNAHTHVLTRTLHTSPHLPQIKKHFTVSDSCRNDL